MEALTEHHNKGSPESMEALTYVVPNPLKHRKGPLLAFKRSNNMGQPIIYSNSVDGICIVFLIIRMFI